MKPLCGLLLALGVALSACDGEPLPASPAVEVTTPTGAPPAASRCDYPASDTIIITQCRTIEAQTCIAQNYAWANIPPDAGIHQTDLAGCPIEGRPDLHCVAACPPDPLAPKPVDAGPPPPPPADATMAPDPPEIVSCDYPAGDHLYVLSCPGYCKICIAQDRPYMTVPDGYPTQRYNLAGCTLPPPSSSIVCVHDCSDPCPI